MFQTGGSFRLATKTFQMRFGGPRAQTDYFESYGAVETYLMRAINHPLTAPANLFEQLVIAKCHFYSARLLRILVLLIKRTEATSE